MNAATATQQLHSPVVFNFGRGHTTVRPLSRPTPRRTGWGAQACAGVVEGAMNGVEGKRCDENDSDEVGIRKRVATVHSKSYWRQARGSTLTDRFIAPSPSLLLRHASCLSLSLSLSPSLSLSLSLSLHGCGAVAAEGASSWRPLLEPPWLWCRTSQGSLLEQLCLHFQLVSDLG